MMNLHRAVSLAVLSVPAMTATAAELPGSIAATGEKGILQAHAEGAQLYECKADAAGKLTWQFREPIATLIVEGKTVGRHYAGPTWQVGESVVVGRVAAHAPGATSKDIPWLKLDVTGRRGDGPLKEVTTVQRINTSGGFLEGTCEKGSDLRSEPYSADYVFLKR